MDGGVVAVGSRALGGVWRCVVAAGAAGVGREVCWGLVGLVVLGVNLLAAGGWVGTVLWSVLRGGEPGER